jgi:hypothetical protein
MYDNATQANQELKDELLLHKVQILAVTKHGDMKIVCSPIRYATLVKYLSEKHKSAIKDVGFEGFLYIYPIYLRRY